MKLPIPVLCSLALSALYAEPNVVVTPLDKSFPSDVRVVSPKDPAFSALARSLAGSHISFFQPILPYSILVQNMTTEPIAEVVVEVDVITADGKMLSEEQTRQSGFPLSGAAPALPSMRTELFAADQVFSDIAARMYDGQMPRHFATPLSEEISRYSSAQTITFTLHSVLFEDGRLIGPDKAARFNVHLNGLIAQRSLDRAVLAYRNHPETELKDFLARAAASMNSNRADGDPAYAQAIRRLANRYRGLLQLRGTDVLFDSIERNQPPPDLSVHR